MSVKQNKKVNTIANAYSYKTYSDTDLRRSALVAVKEDGSVATDNNLSYFLINPSTYTDTKSSNWVAQQTPGQSDPPLQWVSGGPRTVSFQALVTMDTSYFVSGVTSTKTAKPNSVQKASSYFGGIASAFFKVAAPAARVPSGDATSELDITDYLNYYRSLLYPTYNDKSNPTKLLYSPPLVVLFNGTAVPKFPIGFNITTKNDVWVVTNLEIQITKQLPNLAPMEALVTFQLVQYTIIPFGSDRFTDDGQ